MVLIKPDGNSAASDEVPGVTCPYKYAGAVMQDPLGKTIVIGAPSACTRTCGVFDRDADCCSHLSFARSLATALKKLSP